MPEPLLSGRRVLVVEDEYFLADEMAAALRRAGADVLGPVPTVGDALDLLGREHALDAAVLDMSLAGEMVFPVADALTERQVPFVFTTGFDQASLPDRFAKAKRMEKPIETSSTVRELATLCAPDRMRTL